MALSKTVDLAGRSQKKRSAFNRIWRGRMPQPIVQALKNFDFRFGIDFRCSLVAELGSCLASCFATCLNIALGTHPMNALLYRLQFFRCLESYNTTTKLQSTYIHPP